MATEQAPDESESEAPAGKSSKAIWLVTFIAAVAGFATPFAVMQFTEQSASGNNETDYEVPAAGQAVNVPFGQVTVNLREGRMNRYLRIKLSAVVAKSEEVSVNEAFEAQRPVLRNWLLSHISDKALDDISGKAGINMLRREIRSQFNELLFADRRDRIFDILFEEFTIQ